MTKIMIDRDLLERIGELMHIIAHRQDDYGVEAEYLGNILSKVLANPAQQGEAVEVVLPEPDFALDSGSTPCYYAETIRALLASTEGVKDE